MKPNSPNRRFLLWFGFSLLVVLLGFIPVRIAATFGQAPIPQGIFVLGGAAERMEFAGKFWQSHQDWEHPTF